MPRSKEPVIHTMNVGEERTLTVYAAERHSAQRITVKQNESYRITCDVNQRWTDLIIRTSPEGYTNPLARSFGLPVAAAKCFCLCATYNENDANTFAIGSEHTIGHVPINGTLSFFANDVRGYEWNNWGSVNVVVKRLA